MLHRNRVQGIQSGTKAKRLVPSGERKAIAYKNYNEPTYNQVADHGIRQVFQ